MMRPGLLKKIELIPYQDVAVSNILKSLDKMWGLSASPDTNKICILEGCTGCGKTIISAEMIRKFSKKHSDAAFIFISVGRGGLHRQSRKKFLSYIPNNSILLNNNSGVRSLDSGDILFVSWEIINKKNKKTGETKNKVMKDDGDSASLKEIIEATKNKGLKIFLVLDENHHTANTESSKSLIKMIGPEVIFQMSATPNLTDVLDSRSASLGYHYHYKIPYSEVESAEMIKNKFSWNDGNGNTDVFIPNMDDLEVKTVLTNLSLDRRESLHQKYKIFGEINPLLMIQIPNGTYGSKIKRFVTKILKKRGITVENGKLAVWLNNVYQNQESLTENNSEVQVLIFKEACVLGWDAPRAQVLLKFRESNSFQFDTQLLGRLLRMPEQRHYEDQELNTVYVYSDVGLQKLVGKEKDLNIAFSKSQMTRIDGYQFLHLNSEYVSRNDYNDIVFTEFYPIVSKTFNDSFKINCNSIESNVKKLKGAGLTFRLQNKRFIIHNAETSTEETMNVVSLFKNESCLTAEVQMSEQLVEESLKRKIQDLCHGCSVSPVRSADRVISVLSRYFINDVGFKDLYSGDSIANTDSFLLKNFEKLRALIISSINQCRELHKSKSDEDCLQRYVFEVPPQITYNKELMEECFYKKNVYKPCLLQKNRSRNERVFESYLDSCSHVVSWFKNGENTKDSFGLSYFNNKEKKLQTFYPDYIVTFDNGTIGLFEVKDEKDQDALSGTKDKAERLQKFIKIENAARGKNGQSLIDGGIAWITKNDDIYLNRAKVYDYQTQNLDSVLIADFCKASLNE